MVIRRVMHVSLVLWAGRGLLLASELCCATNHLRSSAVCPPSQVQGFSVLKGYLLGWLTFGRCTYNEADFVRVPGPLHGCNAARWKFWNPQPAQPRMRINSPAAGDSFHCGRPSLGSIEGRKARVCMHACLVGCLDMIACVRLNLCCCTWTVAR